jgi:hypothetical protein
MVAIQIVLEASHDLVDFGMPSDNECFAKANTVRVCLSDDEIDQPSLDDQRRERDGEERRQECQWQLDARRKNRDDREDDTGESDAEQETAGVASGVTRFVSAVRIESDQNESDHRRPQSTRVRNRRDLSREKRGGANRDCVEHME